MKRKHNLMLISLMLLFATCQHPEKIGFFHSMPHQFKVDSLEVWKKLFASISVKHFDDNTILFQSSDPDLIPFNGILEAREDTIFYRRIDTGASMPWLKLNASAADTSVINYSENRSDQVVAQGRFYDNYTKDSVYKFELIPIKRRGDADDIYLKSIAMSEGEGIRYLTFGKYMYGNTIVIQNYPKAVGVEGTMPY